MAHDLSFHTHTSVNVTGTHSSLLPAFWSVAAVIVVIIVGASSEKESSDVLAALAISAAALLPGYLWCADRAFGIPVWPLSSFTYVLGFAFPLVTFHPDVFSYTAEERLDAALLVVVFLILTTCIWYPLVRKPTANPRVADKFTLPESRGDDTFLFFIALSAVFAIMAASGWLDIGAELFAVFRGASIGLGSLGTFLLAWRWGMRQLSRWRISFYLTALAVYMVANATSTLLVGAMVAFLLCAIGFSIGRGRAPWKVVIIGVLAFAFLHLGKSEMRERYRYENAGAAMQQPWLYPSFFAEWVNYSWENLTGTSAAPPGQSLIERGSLLHLTLKIRADSPEFRPYLNGETYSFIPALLVPRIFYPEKISSHEGTVMLNIHYGVQTREDAETTGIGWGLLNEALANFGNAGLVGLAFVLALFYGAASRWSAGAPPHSFRFLAALLIMPLCFNTEISAGAYVAALFQSMLALTGVMVFISKVPKSR